MTTASQSAGDTAAKKQYPGGQLDLASARSSPKLRMKSKRVVLIDEVDGAPAELTTGEGSFVAVAEGRTVAFGHRGKICMLSTPTTYERSLIWVYYQEGDQRHYFMPCPHCGEDVNFVWENFDWTTDEAGQVSEVWYKCQNSECGERIYNHHKAQMLPSGDWKPTAKAISESKRSYYMPAFLSPVGMLDWKTIVERYLKAVEDPLAMASWVNLYCGLPYKQAGHRPKADNVIRNKGAYQSGNIPDGVLFLTAFVDVQRGKKGTDAKPARLEMEICGHGYAYKTWSIEYIVVEGAINDAFSGAWEDLHQMALEGCFRYTRGDGRTFGLDLILLDSGDGVYYETVYEFSGRWKNTFPSKGFRHTPGQKQSVVQTMDPMTKDNFKRYRAMNQPGHGVVLYEIATNYYKRALYNRLAIERRPGEVQKPGFCDFPTDYKKEYFQQLTAEELLEDNSFDAGGRANEAHDCRVGNMCAADIFLDAMVVDFQKRYRDAGYDKYQLTNIDKKFVLEFLKQETARALKEN